MLLRRETKDEGKPVSHRPCTYMIKKAFKILAGRKRVQNVERGHQQKGNVPSTRMPTIGKRVPVIVYLWTVVAQNTGLEFFCKLTRNFSESVNAKKETQSHSEGVHWMHGTIADYVS